MKSQRNHFFALAPLLFVLSAPASNGWPAAKLTGVVVDQSGAVIPGTSVTLLSADQTRETKTDEMGQFEFANLPKGEFDLKAEHFGFKVRVIENIRTEDEGDKGDQHLSIMLDLGPASCGVRQPETIYEQRSGKVNLIGGIADFWDGALENATVTITNWKSGKKQVTATDKNGQFQFANLESGKYSLNATRDGYEEQQLRVIFWITNVNLTRLGTVYIAKKNENRVFICM